MAVVIICEECGKRTSVSPSQYKKSEHHFCSRQCRMTWLNRTYNPTRMTPKVREKLRKARLGTGKTLCYEKTYGKHTHRVVAEQILGRPLKKGEVVHHIDGCKRNNSPDNLMIFKNQKEHAKWHADHDMDWGW